MIFPKPSDDRELASDVRAGVIIGSEAAGRTDALSAFLTAGLSPASDRNWELCTILRATKRFQQLRLIFLQLNSSQQIDLLN
jgi:hypothetical protein